MQHGVKTMQHRSDGQAEQLQAQVYNAKVFPNPMTNAILMVQKFTLKPTMHVAYCNKAAKANYGCRVSLEPINAALQPRQYACNITVSDLNRKSKADQASNAGF